MNYVLSVFHAFVSYHTVLYGIIACRVISYCITMLPMVYQNYSVVAYRINHIVSYLYRVIYYCSAACGILLLITHRHLTDDSDDIIPYHIVS